MLKLTCDPAGADLNELGKLSTTEAYRTGWLKDLEIAFSAFRKPIIAAVRGFAVGTLRAPFSCLKITSVIVWRRLRAGPDGM